MPKPDKPDKIASQILTYLRYTPSNRGWNVALERVKKIIGEKKYKTVAQALEDKDIQKILKPNLEEICSSIPLAGRASSTVLSHLGAEHSHGRGILGFLGLKNATSLRRVCSEFRNTVAEFPWDKCKKSIWNGAHIGRTLQLFHSSFPKAKCINISRAEGLINENFQDYLKGLEEIYMSECDKDKNPDLTNSAFEGFTKIKFLDISRCTDLFTDDVFNNMPNLVELRIKDCTQFTAEGARNLHTHCKKLEYLDFIDCSPEFQEEILKLFPIADGGGSNRSNLEKNKSFVEISPGKIISIRLLKKVGTHKKSQKKNRTRKH